MQGERVNVHVGLCIGEGGGSLPSVDGVTPRSRFPIPAGWVTVFPMPPPCRYAPPASTADGCGTSPQGGVGGVAAAGVGMKTPTYTPPGCWQAQLAQLAGGLAPTWGGGEGYKVGWVMGDNPL